MSWELLDEETQVYHCEYQVDTGIFARCLAVGLGGGEYLLISPPGPLDADRLYDDFAAIGQPVAFLAPNRFHNLGLQPGLKRFPSAEAYAHKTAADRLRKKRLTTKPLRDVSELQKRLPEAVELLYSPHQKFPEAITRIRTRNGSIWFFVDILQNMQEMPRKTILRLLMKMLGFKTGLMVNRFGCKHVMKSQQPAFQQWLLEELQRVPPTLFVPAHGAILQEDTSRQLQEKVSEFS